MKLVRCLLYLAAIGAGSFILGRVLPKRLFHWERFPFRPFGWEKNGSVYNKLGIRRWKEKVPDMSAILPKLMPSKKLPTCVAEWIHGLLCVLGFGCVLIWDGLWGWAVSVIYALGNMPDILIQRYNRPKLVRILQITREREAT